MYIYAPHIEMDDMVASGMTPMQVIVAATRNGAQFLRLNDDGTIETNKSAHANPLDNITNTRKISSDYLSVRRSTGRHFESRFDSRFESS